MSKQLFPMHDRDLERLRKQSIGYRSQVEKVEATLKARYGDAYKRWPEARPDALSGAESCIQAIRALKEEK
jgi:hypothetical protein